MLEHDLSCKYNHRDRLITAIKSLHHTMFLLKKYSCYSLLYTGKYSPPFFPSLWPSLSVSELKTWQLPTFKVISFIYKLVWANLRWGKIICKCRRAKITLYTVSIIYILPKNVIQFYTTSLYGYFCTFSSVILVSKGFNMQTWGMNVVPVVSDSLARC